MPPPPATRELYETVQRYELLLISAGRRLWRRMLPGDFDGSWSRIAPQMVAFTSGAQLAAARAAVAYVPAALEQQDIVVDPLVDVRPAAFAGIASDGRSLAGLLEGAPIRAKRLVANGWDGGDALVSAQNWLEQVLQSAVADAARDASQAAIAARPTVQWVRMVNPPCCSRCAVLAGRVYRWNEGFPRHPQCDCLHIPTTVAGANRLLTDATELAKRGQITDLTAAQRQRIDGGANLNRVLNESRDRWRQHMAADRRRERTARERWSGRLDDAPAGATIHDLFGRLTSQVDAATAMRAAGIAT
jgi:hypothetical protein